MAKRFITTRLKQLRLRPRPMMLVLLALLPAFALIIYNTITENRLANAEVTGTAPRLVRGGAKPSANNR